MSPSKRIRRAQKKLRKREQEIERHLRFLEIRRRIKETNKVLGIE